MIEADTKFLIFIRDFTNRNRDQFYWLTDNELTLVRPSDITGYNGILVCHDFWAIRDLLFESTGTLPGKIIDLDELRIATSGDPADRETRDKSDITKHLLQNGANADTCSAYRRMWLRGQEFDTNVGRSIAYAMEIMYGNLIEAAKENREAERFFEIEMPVFRIVQLAMAKGIRIDTVALAQLRREAEMEYFIRLKNYSSKHDMPLESPSDDTLRDKITELGFDLTGVSIDYILEYIPHATGFGADTISLREVDAARKVLSALTLSSDRIRPLADIFGSRTSRIQLRNPALQNISKSYRRIILPEKGHLLSYVDFDQYEVGIMAALSGDEELHRLYRSGDMYELFAAEHLGIGDNRKASKQLFLSYAYGMSQNALVDAAVSLGSARDKAKGAFRRFGTYEKWKKSVVANFQRSGVVETDFGNHFKRQMLGPMTSRETRSVISQIVQGTASLIFKKVIIEVAKIEDVTIALPMHDALLFSHIHDATCNDVVAVFQSVLTQHLKGQITGKASIGRFRDD